MDYMRVCTKLQTEVTLRSRAVMDEVLLWSFLRSFLSISRQDLHNMQPDQQCTCLRIIQAQVQNQRSRLHHGLWRQCKDAVFVEHGRFHALFWRLLLYLDGTTVVCRQFESVHVFESYEGVVEVRE
jgi:hypothetical protein